MWTWIRVAAAPVIDRPLERPAEPIAAPGDVLTVFAVLWAVANLFHVWGPSATGDRRAVRTSPRSASPTS